MPHTQSRGSPEFAATSEPERLLSERLSELRDRLSRVILQEDEAISHIPAPVPFPVLDMGEPPRRTIHEMANDGLAGARFPYARPAMPNGNNWQIPSHVINSITNSTQFNGLDDEDAPEHLSRFTRITGVTPEAIYLCLFPFSLGGRAASWLDILPDNSISTWADMQAKFLNKYYPPSKAARIRDQIHSFHMDADEPYHMAWERFNTLLSKCLQHGLSDWDLIKKFYNGITFQMQQQFNTSAGGDMMEKKDADECIEMFEDFAMAEQQQPRSRDSKTVPSSSTRGLHHVSTDTGVAAELASLKKLFIDNLAKMAAKCEVCQGGHDTVDCHVVPSEQVDYVGNPN
jgi:hypothetical protein